MDWRILLEPDVQDFMRQNMKMDVATLALKKPPSASWPYPLILDQIKTRQKAINKTPDLCEMSGFIFAPSSTYEQASSQACAAYKANQVSGERFVDLTAGCGIDSFYLARKFSRGDLIERDAHVSEVLAHNSGALKGQGFFDGTVQVHNADAEDFLDQVKDVDLIYIDPQRREKDRKGIFDFKACSPDVTSLLAAMIGKSKRIMIKTSPVLDISQAIEVLVCISEVHVVGWDGDCKEVNYLIDCNKKTEKSDVLVVAVEVDRQGMVVRRFQYRNGEEQKAIVGYSMPEHFIYEPGPAFQKAGGYNSMAEAFPVSKLHPHSHLYTSQSRVHDFPGRVYEVEDVISAQVKKISVDQAEISIRNYPGKPEDLRKKLKLKDGGNHRIFATTLIDGSKKLVLCKKLT